MKRSLEAAKPFAEAFAKLLYPFAEVVIHDLKKDVIEAIFNPLSRRVVGDPSYLDRVDFARSDRVIGPYPKTNWDGRPMKSISIVLRGSSGLPEGFLCINVDVSAFRGAVDALQLFLQSDISDEESSRELFRDDLYDRINCYVQEYCRGRQISVEALNRKERRELVRALAAEGAFSGKHAASYIARVVGLSRATVYNYLKGEE